MLHDFRLDLQTRRMVCSYCHNVMNEGPALCQFGSRIGAAVPRVFVDPDDRGPLWR